MSRCPTPYPALPRDTARAARSVLHLQCRYLDLGDQLDILLGDVRWADLDPTGVKPLSLVFVLAMVTVFQFAEDLADRRAALAVCKRIDWKYALHLPLDYPGIRTEALAEFRQRLRHHSAGQRVFQQMLARLTELDLVTQQADVATVLSTVEIRNCLEEMNEAMRLALEALACGAPDRLRTMTLPYWYQRYGQPPSPLHVPQTSAGRQALLEALEADVSSLLAAIAGEEPTLFQWPELQALQRLWQDSFGSAGQTIAQCPEAIETATVFRARRHGRHHT